MAGWKKLGFEIQGMNSHKKEASGGKRENWEIGEKNA